MKILKTILKTLLLLLLAGIGIYFIGPKVDAPDMDLTLPKVTSDLRQLEKEINEGEAANTLIKPENASRIVWQDSVPEKTPYSMVYLHGWSASSKEGDPIHLEMAKKYGCNLYLPRLAGHGLEEEEPMLSLTADHLIASAKEAIAIGKQLGDKVIVMATSTGGTLALHLAGEDEDVAALVLYSPNIEIYDSNAKLLAGPWGLQLGKLVQGDYHVFESTEVKRKYWTTRYRTEALTHLQSLVKHTMTDKTFKKVSRPVFLGYFYKDENIHDKTVSVPAMLEMYEMLGIEEPAKRKVAFAEVNDHVVACSLTSEDLESVRSETSKFFEEVIGMQPLD